MQLLLPLNIQASIIAELRKAGRRESGGILLGEHIGDDMFKIVGITTQESRGTASHFERDSKQHAVQLEAFFEEHGENCSRFNYLGEWHSHPSFDVSPSARDLVSMREIVSDSSVGANFAVLVIVRLSSSGALILSATLCQPYDKVTPVQVYAEAAPPVKKRRVRIL